MNGPTVTRYINGDVSILKYTSDQRQTYWLKAGVGELEFPPEKFHQLVELTSSFVTPPEAKWLFLVSLITFILGLATGLIIGV